MRWFLLLWLASAGCGDAERLQPSTAASAPRVGPVPRLSIEPDAIDLGEVPAGSRSRFALWLTPGEGPLPVLTALRWASGSTAAAVLLQPRAPALVQAEGGLVRIEVGVAVGPLQDELQLMGPDGPWGGVTVHAVGRSPLPVRIDPPALALRTWVDRPVEAELEVTGARLPQLRALSDQGLEVEWDAARPVQAGHRVRTRWTGRRVGSWGAQLAIEDDGFEVARVPVQVQVQAPSTWTFTAAGPPVDTDPWSQDVRAFVLEAESDGGLIRGPPADGVGSSEGWSGFGPLLRRQQLAGDQDARVVLRYASDCRAVPSPLLRTLLGVAIDGVLAALGPVLVGSGSAWADALDELCLDRAPLTVAWEHRTELDHQEGARTLQRRGDRVVVGVVRQTADGPRLEVQP
jgi:hypothetical protein